jgi:hypothetical protein
MEEDTMAQKKETQPKAGGDIIQATIGDNASQVAVGKNIRQQDHSSAIEVSEADLQQVKLLFDELKQQIEQQAPPEKKAAALERVDELQQEIASKKPDPTTFGYVKNWFGKNLPTLLGSVTALVVNPLVGKVVEAASTVAAEAIKRQFGAK